MWETARPRRWNSIGCCRIRRKGPLPTNACASLAICQTRVSALQESVPFFRLLARGKNGTISKSLNDEAGKRASGGPGRDFAPDGNAQQELELPSDACRARHLGRTPEGDRLKSARPAVLPPATDQPLSSPEQIFQPKKVQTSGRSKAFPKLQKSLTVRLVLRLGGRDLGQPKSQRIPVYGNTRRLQQCGNPSQSEPGVR